ncbi:MAG: GNAT family N-acetyltransferase, partial [Pseudomonadota bacterium]
MQIRIRQADYSNPHDMALVIQLLDQYAKDPFGGGEGLSDQTKATLGENLRAFGHAFTLLAFDGDEAVGLANCLRSFSTFKAAPVLNIHDFAVSPLARGRGIGQLLLKEIERIAKDQGCYKVTLEVLSENHPAKNLYKKFGFGDYQLDPSHGT